MKKIPALIVRANHFDPIWRRCWDRPFYDGGRRFASYREIERAFYDDALASGEAFSAEAAWTVRKYAEAYPERLPQLKQSFREGRFELLGAGENIIDSNMVGTECLIRNMVLGLLWGRDTFGETPCIPWFNDLFGTSAQLPQLVRECDMIPWANQLDYNIPDAPCWIGLDGSAMVWNYPGNIARDYPCSVISFGKHKPCDACKGEGCTECNGRGYKPYFTARLDRMPDENRDMGDAEILLCCLSGEEILPDKELTEHIRDFNEKSERYEFRAVLYKDILPYLKEYIAIAGNPKPGEISTKTENNPGQTGCYVSRIRVKQGERLTENLMAMCETWDTILNEGRQHETLKELWRDISFTCQHDAITGEHIDQASDELLDFEEDERKRLLECAAAISPVKGDGVTVLNHNGFPVSLAARAEGIQYPSVTDPEGKPVPVYSDGSFLAGDLPALSGRCFSITEGTPAEPIKGMAGTYSMDNYSVTVGEQGIEKVVHAEYGLISGSDYYFGEPVTDLDIGDPWCTRHRDHSRERLSQYMHLEGVEVYPHEIRINYAGKHPKGLGHLTSDANMVFDFSWKQSFVLRRGIDRIDVETKVHWYTQNCRLRLAFPGVTDSDKGIYEIPGGIMERERYEHTGYDSHTGAGDWPCVRWFGIDSGDYIFTVMNQGTPSARIEEGTAFVSILRSPTQPGWLFEPNFYEAYNFCRIGDPGDHSFVHSFAAVPDRLAAMRAAAGFNTIPLITGGPAPAPFTELRAEGTMLTAIKQGEYEGVVIRLTEYLGKEETALLKLPEGCNRAYLCNMLEDNREEAEIREGRVLVPVKPHQIVTVKLCRDR